MKTFLSIRKMFIKKIDESNFEITTTAGKIKLSKFETIVLILSHGIQTPKELIERIHLISKEPSPRIKKILNKLLRLKLLLKTNSSITYPFDVVQVLNNCNKKQSNSVVCMADLLINIGRACNLNCVICSSNVNHDFKVAGFKDLKSLMTQARKLGCISLGITGGEPTLEKNIRKTLKILRFAEKIGFSSIAVATNGYGVKKYGSHLRKIRPLSLVISFQGWDKQYNDFFYGHKGTNRLALGAIDYCLKNNIRFRINCVVTRINKNEVNKIINWASKKNMLKTTNQLMFSALLPLGSALKSPGLFLKPHELKEIYKIVYNQNNQHILTTVNKKYDDCSNGLWGFYANDGCQIFPCEALEMKENCWGNAREKKLEKIILSEKADDFRRKRDICRSICENYRRF